MAGHGCGHSVFGTASTGAALAIKQALAAGSIKGTVKLFGTPAEATYSYGAPGHSWQVAACTGMSIGEKGRVVAAKTIAATAVDFVDDEDYEPSLA